MMSKVRALLLAVLVCGPVECSRVASAENGNGNGDPEPETCIYEYELVHPTESDPICLSYDSSGELHEWNGDDWRIYWDEAEDEAKIENPNGIIYAESEDGHLCPDSAHWDEVDGNTVPSISQGCEAAPSNEGHDLYVSGLTVEHADNGCYEAMSSSDWGSSWRHEDRDELGEYDLVPLIEFDDMFLAYVLYNSGEHHTVDELEWFQWEPDFDGSLNPTEPPWAGDWEAGPDTPSEETTPTVSRVPEGCEAVLDEVYEDGPLGMDGTDIGEEDNGNGDNGNGDNGNGENGNGDNGNGENGNGIGDGEDPPWGDDDGPDGPGEDEDAPGDPRDEGDEPPGDPEEEWLCDKDLVTIIEQESNLWTFYDFVDQFTDVGREETGVTFDLSETGGQWMDTSGWVWYIPAVPDPSADDMQAALDNVRGWIRLLLIGVLAAAWVAAVIRLFRGM